MVEARVVAVRAAVEMEAVARALGTSEVEASVKGSRVVVMAAAATAVVEKAAEVEASAGEEETAEGVRSG